MSWVGEPLRRGEDDKLLKGAGRFLADLRLPGTLEAVFVRSEHAHAEVRSIDVRAARGVSGVVAVITAADLGGCASSISVKKPAAERIAAQLKPLDRAQPIPVLARERVTHVGQTVAMVVAERRVDALDAAELVAVDYAPLPAVVDPVAALAPEAPLLEPGWGTNLALSVAATKGKVDEAFADASVVIEEEFYTHRYVAAPIETRGIQASIDLVTGQLTVWASTQTAYPLRALIASSLGMPIDSVRVITCDVGGGFGQKGVQYVEDVLVCFASRTLGRPVRWVETRSENLVAASHARDQVHRIAIAASRDGRILGVRDEAVMNCGAYNFLGLVVPYNALAHLLGPYHVPNASIRVKGVLTNTCFTSPYRGAGRPEAVFAMERIIERLADRLGMEPADLRAKNLVPAEAMPYDTGLLYRDGAPQVYDSGNYPELLSRARKLIDLEGVRRLQREQTGPRLLGVGFALSVEGTGIGPYEGAVARLLPSGRVRIATGACSAGQGHGTAYAQIAADVLGVAPQTIEVIGGDTSLVAHGIGSVGSRSTVAAGNAVQQATRQLKQRILAVGTALLEAAEQDLELVGDKVRVRGTDRHASLAQIAAGAADAVLRRGQPGDGLIAEAAYFRPSTVTYASAAHAATVVVDVETGSVELQRYVVVHDCGRVVNPLLADGQIAGGVLQGIGGVLQEAMVYDTHGQPLTGSFMDYSMPVAGDVPALQIDHLETLSTRNPLGVKGVGEGGAIASPAAVANAVENALKRFTVIVRRGPLTPGRVRELIQAGAGPA